jgi:DNA-directed RNA polymerase specialized sigma24 family protein
MQFVRKYVLNDCPTGFELLYHHSVDRLVRQVYLATADRERARQAVHRAFGRAARSWAEVASDESPEGWVRADAFDLALSPWRSGGPREMHGLAIREFLDSTRLHALTYRLERPLAPTEPGLTAEDRMLLGALLRLPRPYRRALVLHDALGLSWGETATEVEATTEAACGRVIRSRVLLANRLPTLLGADWEASHFGPALGARLRAAAARGCPDEIPHAPLSRVRRAGRVRGWLPTAAAGAAVAATAALFAASWPAPAPHVPIAQALRVNVAAFPGLPTAPAPQTAPKAPRAPAAAPLPIAAFSLSPSPARSRHRDQAPTPLGLLPKAPSPKAQ